MKGKGGLLGARLRDSASHIRIVAGKVERWCRLVSTFHISSAKFAGVGVVSES